MIYIKMKQTKKKQTQKPHTHKKQPTILRNKFWQLKQYAENNRNEAIVCDSIPFESYSHHQLINYPNQIFLHLVLNWQTPHFVFKFIFLCDNHCSLIATSICQIDRPF